MKKHIFKTAIASVALSMVFLQGCEEKQFSEDYDIDLPVSEIIDFNPKNQTVDNIVTVYGENLDMVTNLSIGNVSCEIISQESETLVFKVSRSAEVGNIAITNKYRRTNIAEEAFTPEYLDVEITTWPSEIERGLTITIAGENVDMIQTVRFENTQLNRSSATPTTVTYSTAGLELPESGQLTVTTRTAQTLVSPIITVIDPRDSYIPKKSLLLFDFDTTDPVVLAGDATGAGAAFTAGKNLGSIVPYFGNYYSVIAPLGNGWNGQYQYLESTNDGAGFNLTDYTDPHITFLVNTNGKQGYFNPALTIGGSTEDKHFTGQGGEYSDNYTISTDGWEWRSYSLSGLGYPNVKTTIERISLFIRGGNVGNGNEEAFELHIDQVMITDGPLNPVLVFDFETMPQFHNGTASQNGGTGLSAAGQGNNYLTVKDANASSWSGKGSVVKPGNDGSKFDTNKLFYVNFLINTGTGGADGYFQLIFEQPGDTKLGHHFQGGNPYGDDYKFSNTAGQWQWRSYPIDPKGLENWGSAPELNLNNPFDFTVDFSTGNVSGLYEVNLDYVILTSVPLDTKQ